ncbi:methyltransferase domain-containing protein [Neobacillus niacini]|uniref:methyltransferase domain-containing protein n=1 Tax=Neobacillus niacini TaxID=86668 RepID=UPI003B02CC51
MTKKPLDRIAEAYKGDMGEDFGKKTRYRINWIVNHVEGNNVLDIGCSQGIVPIILGREGKNVDALDIAQESIEYAMDDLKNEHVTVQENVNFRVSNFMTEEQLEPTYETILLTEVLEHISDPLSFLKKIHDHLDKEGRAVVTVPFGINDYFDHKRTYYFLELYDHLSAFFTIEKIEYLGNWVGVICKKNIELTAQPQKAEFSRETIQTLENAFYILERELVTKIENFQTTIKQKNEYVKRLQTQHSQYIEGLKEQLEQRNSQIKTLNNRVNELEKIEISKTVEIKEEKKNNSRLLEQIQQKEKEVEFLKKKEFDLQVDLIKKLEEIKQEKEKNKSLVNKSNNELKEYKSSIKKVEKQHQLEIEKFKKQIKHKEKEVETLKKKETDYQNQQIKKLEEIKLEKEKNKNLLNQANTQLIEYKSLIDDLEKQHRINSEEFIEAIQTKENEVDDLKVKLVNLQMEKEKNTEELLQKDTIIDELKQNINNLKANEAKSLEEIKEEIKSKQILLAREKEKAEQISALQQEVKKHLGSLEKYKEQIKLKDQEKEQLNFIIKQKVQNSTTPDIHPNTRLYDEIKKRDNLIIDLNKQVEMLKAELLTSLTHEEKSLKSNLKEKEEYSKLENFVRNIEDKLSKLERKYMALKTSRLGSMTLKYWQLKRKYTNKVRSN